MTVLLYAVAVLVVVYFAIRFGMAKLFPPERK